MAATYDPTTTLGRVRLLAADTDVDNALLTDEDLTALLDLRGDDPTLAAASALRVIASSETLVLKRIRLLDLDLNGPAVAEALRKNADSLEAQVEAAGTVEITD